MSLFSTARIAALLLACATVPLAAGEVRAHALPWPAGALPGDTAQTAIAVGEGTADLTWTVTGPAFRQVLPVTAPDSVTSITVDTLPLRGPDGAVVPLRAWFGRDSGAVTANVGGSRVLALHLAADLPKPGEYRGTLVLTAGRSRTVKTFSVTWARRTAAVAVRGLGAVEATLGFGAVEVPLTLEDTLGQPATLRRPVLESLQRYGAADTTLQVNYGAVQVVDDSGHVLPATVTLAPDDARRVRLRIPGLHGAGRYGGTVHIAAADAGAVQAAFTLYARRSWVVAALLIALGVVISAFIRHYRLSLRPRLLRQRRAAELLEWLTTTVRQLAAIGALTDDETAVAGTLRDRLQHAVDDPDAPPQGDAGAQAAKDADARLALYAARLDVLPDWINGRRLIDTVTDDSIRADLQDTLLVPVRDALTDGDDAAVKAAAATARSIPQKVRDALKQKLLDDVTAFGKIVDDERAAHPTNDAFLERMQAEVQNRLAAARTAADAGRMDAARAAYAAARAAFADVLAADLRLRLAQPRPNWMQQAAWDALGRDVGQALTLVPAGRTPDARILAFEAAQGLYLRTLATAMEPAIVTTRGTAGVTGAQKADLDAAAQAARDTLAHAANGELHAAAASFAAAEQKFDAVNDALVNAAPQGGPMGGAASRAVTAGVAAAPGDPTAIRGVPGGVAFAPAQLVATSAVRRLGTAELARALARGDFAVDVLVGLIAIAVGLSLLWANHLTWGSTGDLFAAFLWGLGLHQVGTAAATAGGGTAGILDLVTGKAS